MAKEDLFDLVDLPKLKTAIDEDKVIMEPYKQNLVQHVREFCSGHWSDSPDATHPDNPTNPVNLIALFTRIITDQLVPSDPRFMASTETMKIRPYAKIYEQSGNRKLRKMGFADIVRTAIVDAAFLIGIVKTAITAPAEARFGYGKVIGEATMDNIPVENFICDMTATKFKHCDYMGHEYDAFLEDVKGSKLFDRKARDLVIPIVSRVHDKKGNELVEQIGRGQRAASSQYYEKARLCEIWLRRENVVVTFDAEGSYEKPLLVQKWVGPKCGPYKFLSFGDVLGNLMPKGLICDLIDMHREFNLLWRKMGNQAADQKTVFLYKDNRLAERHKDAHDRDYIQSDDPKGIEATGTPGPDANVFNYAMASYNMFKQFSGGLDTLAGMGPQADTATQEKLMHASAGKQVEALGSRVQTFCEDLMGMDGIGWFWWESPRDIQKSEYQAPGVPDVSVERNLTPQMRFGIPAEEVDIEVDVYSFIRQTPQMRVKGLDDTMTIITKFLPLFNQPGISDALAEWIRLRAHYLNNQDMNVLLEKLQGIQGPPEGEEAQDQPADSPEETIHTRVSKPGMTDQGNMQAIMQRMAGGEMSLGGGDQQQLGQMGQAG